MNIFVFGQEFDIHVTLQPYTENNTTGLSVEIYNPDVNFIKTLTPNEVWHRRTNIF